MSSHRFVELVVLARRFVTPARGRAKSQPTRATGRRQIGGELTQFSFRLAFMIDLVYVGVGAFGGAALTRGALGTSRLDGAAHPPCASGPNVAGTSNDSTSTSPMLCDSTAHCHDVRR